MKWILSTFAVISFCFSMEDPKCLGKTVKLNTFDYDNIALYFEFDEGFDWHNIKKRRKQDKKNQLAVHSNEMGMTNIFALRSGGLAEEFHLEDYLGIKFSHDGFNVYCNSEKECGKPEYEPRLIQSHVARSRSGDIVRDENGEKVKVNELRNLYESTLGGRKSIKEFFEDKWYWISWNILWKKSKWNDWKWGEAPNKEEQKELAWSTFLYYLRYNKNPLLKKNQLQFGGFHKDEFTKRKTKAEFEQVVCIDQYVENFVDYMGGEDFSTEEDE